MSQEPVSDNENMVLNALRDERWHFRTIQGISKETDIPPDEVEKIISKFSSVVTQAAVPDKLGRRLFTAREDSSENMGLAMTALAFVSKSLG